MQPPHTLFFLPMKYDKITKTNCTTVEKQGHSRQTQKK